jgi:ADP-ribose pyrophosphatase YjhB (NUDIX family)
MNRMAKIIEGDRIGLTAAVRFGCSGVIFDETPQKILLTRRSDNQLWCLPGGALNPGESVSETCMREIFEETGMNVRIVRLIEIYSSPHRIVEYADGNRYQIIALNFEVAIVSGEPNLSSETIDIGYFTPDEIKKLALMSHHWERIQDAFAENPIPFIR